MQQAIRRRKRYLGMLRRSITLLLFTAFLLTATGQVEATDGVRGLAACVVEQDEVITDDFYFACNTLEVYGYIDGDLVGIASEVTIARQGRVEGDVWMVGGQLTVEGVLGGDVRFLGVDLDVTSLARFPNPRTDIVAAGGSLEIAEGTVIPNDVIYYGYQLLVEGSVNGDIDFQGQTLIIENNVGGNVSAIVGDPETTAPLPSFPILYSVDFRDPGLYFADSGSDKRGYINGNLSYEASQRISTRERVGGAVEFNQSIPAANLIDAQQSETFFQIVANYFLVTVRDVIAIYLVGILLLNLIPPSITEPAYRVQKRPISAFSWGLISTLLSIPTTLLIIVASLLVVLVTFIIALSAIEITVMSLIVVLFFNLGFIGGFFFLLAFLGRSVTCFVVGYYALRAIQQIWLRQRDDAPPKVFSEVWAALFMGSVIISMLVHMPLGSFFYYIQLGLSGIVATMGFGALLMYFRDMWYASNVKDVVVIENEATAIVSAIPPDDLATPIDLPLGMSNLPSGFNGFDDWVLPDNVRREDQ